MIVTTNVPCPLRSSSLNEFCFFEEGVIKTSNVKQFDPYPQVVTCDELHFPVHAPEQFNRAIEELREKGSTDVLPASATHLRAWAAYFSRVPRFVKTRVCYFDRSCKNRLNCAFAHTGELMKVIPGTLGVWLLANKLGKQVIAMYRRSIVEIVHNPLQK